MIDPQRILRENSRNQHEIHRRFLELRKTSLEGVESLLKLQLAAASPFPRRVDSPPKTHSTPLFNSYQLSEFATGSLSNCFGAEYEAYTSRRFPRIPNGELALISRVLSIHGEKCQFDRPASIVSEYDVPADAWFFRENNNSEMPYSICMEIALQPCGFLSAYLGTPTICPDQEFFFRNLDGQGRLQAKIDTRGKTITAQARLHSTLVSGSTIIQRFDFDLECEGQVFYQGNSVFGYFSPEAMLKQAGLDGGRKTQPLYCQGNEKLPDEVFIDLTEPTNVARFYQAKPERHNYHLAQSRLNLLGRVFLSRNGGRHGSGYIYARTQVDPQDWFYRCHFFQDPVMPGSLGIEAILQALQTYALHFDLGKEFQSPTFGHLSGGAAMNWRYRGQIVPSNHLMQIEAHITHIDHSQKQITIEADASLWADDVRIYEVKGASIGLMPEGR
jgi:3-hydroxymyristoyl/3-hydroxydecanoyl-(acyl carrier protein) dehydratase